MQRMRFAWIAAVVAGLAAAVAGAATAAGTSSKDVTLNLVAYSTPRPVLDKLIEEFQQDAAGVRRQRSGVVRPVLGAGSGRRQRPPGRRRHPQHGQRHQRPRRQGPRRQELGQAELQRRRLELGRRLRPPQRQPEEDQGLERPAQARRRGRHRQPVHGRHRQVEHPRRLRRAAAPRQDRQAGDRLPADVLQEQRRLPGLVGIERDEHVPVGQGRRPPHVRERGDQREDPVRDPAADDADRHLHRGLTEEPAQDRVERLLALPEDVPGAEDPRRQRLPAGRQEGARRVPATSSRCGRARRRSRARCSAAGAPSTRSGSTRTTASCKRSSSRSECRRTGS